MAIGQDTRVNTTTTFGQLEPTMTALPDGGWVVAWASYDQDGDGGGVYQQQFAANGKRVGTETHVSTTTSGQQQFASVAALDSGGWVVVWDGNGVNGNGAYMQRYDSHGVAEGTETPVNALATGSHDNPSVAGLTDGGFIVSWEDNQVDGDSYHGIVNRRFNAKGTASKDESLVNTYTTSDQESSVVSGLADGGWVTAWQSNGEDGDSYGVYQQRYNANGSTHGGETRVNSYTTGAQLYPVIAALDDGGWVVGWASAGQGGGGAGVYMQRYAADGQTDGGERRVTFSEYGASMTALAGGGWVVSWQAHDTVANSYRSYQKAFDADGKVMMKQMQLGSATHAQELPSVTGLADGGWIVSWGDFDRSKDDYDVRQQRFEADGQFYGTNDRPSGTDKTVRIDEGFSYAFQAGSFGFKDAAGEHDRLAEIIIVSAPKIGRLTLDGAVVHAGDRIAQADLDDLAWTPPRHANGDALASFKFRVVDDGGTEAGGHDTARLANTITFNVTAAIDGTDAGETLRGTNRHDVLDGGKGDDKLIGRDGSDIFVFGRGYGHDTIADFTPTGADHDVIDLRNLSSVEGFADLKANHMSQHGDDVWIDGGKGDLLVLNDVGKADLSKDDFVF